MEKVPFGIRVLVALGLLYAWIDMIYDFYEMKKIKKRTMIILFIAGAFLSWAIYRFLFSLI